MVLKLRIPHSMSNEARPHETEVNVQARMIAKSATGQVLILCLMGSLAGCVAMPDERVRPFGFDYVEPVRVAELLDQFRQIKL